MQNGFLDIIKKKFGDGDYAGDEFGGAKGSDGSGQPDGSSGRFMFATGVECSYPTIDNGRTRRDLLEECGHYEHWQKDFQLTRELGLRVLRYGLPYHKVSLGPDKYDWSFADVVMAEMRRLDILPILDLMHFGVPDWIGNFQNPELPVHFAAYAAAVAERYPWVRYYTPVNEIYVTARISGKDGIWNEQLKTDAGFVTALKHCVAASIMGTHELAKRRPDLVIVQSESAEIMHEAKAKPSPDLVIANKTRFLSLDLLYAHPPDSDVCMYLLDNGLTREEYNWFMRGEPPGYQIMGNDYYGRNEHLRLPDGTVIEGEDIAGWYGITKTYYQRYLKPVMHTETNVMDAEKAPNWLWKQWINIQRMRSDGVPVLGFTWYSLTDQIDWDIELAEKKGTVNPCGLYDLQRNPRPVAEAYRQLLQEFGNIPLVPHGAMFEFTDKPASLQIDV